MTPEVPNVARRPRKAATVRALGPLGDASWRMQALEKAGVTPDRAAAILNQAIQSAETAMGSAMHPLNHTVPDWNSRLIAARFLVTVFGLMPGKNAQPADGGKQVGVTIVLPDWAAPREPKAAGSGSTQPRVIPHPLPNPD